MPSYIRISVSATEAQQEMLMPTMMEFGCEGFEQTSCELICYLKNDELPGAQEKIRSEVAERIRYISANAAISVDVMDKINWNEEWEKSVQPIEIGNKFVVKPSWASYLPRDERIILHIDPKMSFGTGYHETTRLTLQLIEKYLEKDDEVLDVGTGTGILAIASVKLGAKIAVGTDIDEWSLENADENVKRNGVESRVRIENRELKHFDSNSRDLITANLTLNTNVELMGEFRRILRQDGMLLLSGLLKPDRRAMEESLTRNGFEPIEMFSENEWIAIAARKL